MLSTRPRRSSSGWAAVEAAMQSRRPEGGRGDDAQASRLVDEEWLPRRAAPGWSRGAWTDRAFRQRGLAENGRAAVDGTRHRAAAPPPAPGRSREHAEGPQRHLLHAVLVHRLHGHRPAARLVQGPRVPGPRRARVAQRVARDGPRRAGRGRGAGLGHHRRHPLHGAAAAAAAHRRLDRGCAGGDRHAGRNDRRGERSRPRRRSAWTASTTSAACRATARCATRPKRRRSTRPGNAGPTRCTAWRCSSASSTWTSTAMRSSAWRRATTWGAGYYERTLTSLATLLVEKGLVTHEELEARARAASSLWR